MLREVKSTSLSLVAKAFLLFILVLLSIPIATAENKSSYAEIDQEVKEKQRVLHSSKKKEQKIIISDKSAKVGSGISYSGSDGSTHITVNTGVAEIFLDATGGVSDINIINSNAMDSYDGALSPNFSACQSSPVFLSSRIQLSSSPSVATVPITTPPLKNTQSTEMLEYTVSFDISPCFGVADMSYFYNRRFLVTAGRTEVEIFDEFINNTSSDTGSTPLTYYIDSGIDGNEEYLYSEVGSSFVRDFDITPTATRNYFHFRNYYSSTSDSYPYIGWGSTPSRILAASGSAQLDYNLNVPANTSMTMQFLVGNATSDAAAQLQASTRLGLNPPTGVNIFELSSVDIESCPVIRANIYMDSSILPDPANPTHVDFNQFVLEETVAGSTLPVSNISINPVGQYSSGSGVALGLALDRSGSFAAEQAALNTASLNLVWQMSQYDRMAIIEFGDGNIVKQALTNDSYVLETAISSIPAVGSGSTYMYGGILDAISEVQNSSNTKAVIVIADGQSNDSGEQHVIDEAKRLGVTIFTIGFGNSVDVPALQRLAEETGGVFYHTANSNDISTIYSRIRRDIAQQMRIEYISPFTGSTPRDLQIQYSNNGQTYSLEHTYQCEESSVDIRSISENGDNPPEVSVYFSVEDQSGNPVQNLTENDLCSSNPVSERGQPVNNFTLTTAGQSASNLNLALVLDRSGSFSSEQASMNAALSELINNKQSGDHYSVINFGDNVSIDQSLTSDAAGLLHAITNPNGIGGGTALYDAIKAGLYELNGLQGQNALAVITDGDDTSSSSDISSVIGLAESLGIPIYMISFGSGYDQSTFEQIANMTGGSVSNASTIQDLEEIINDARGFFAQQYVLTYVSEFDRTVSDRKVSICLDSYGSESEFYSLSHIYLPTPALVAQTGYITPSGNTSAPSTMLNIPLILENMNGLLGSIRVRVTDSQGHLIVTSLSASGATLELPNGGNELSALWSSGIGNGPIMYVGLDAHLMSTGRYSSLEVEVLEASDLNGNPVSVGSAWSDIKITMPVEISLMSPPEVMLGSHNGTAIPVHINTQDNSVGAVNIGLLTNIPMTGVSLVELQPAGVLQGSNATSVINPSILEAGLTAPHGIYGDSHIANIMLDFNSSITAALFNVDIDPSRKVVFDTNGWEIPSIVGSGALINVILAADGDLAPLGSRDGYVNVADALIALRYALGLIPPPIPAEDMSHGDVAPLASSGEPDPDGVINVADALVILRKALGLIQF